MSLEVRAAILAMSRDGRLALLDEVWALVRDDTLPFPASAAELREARERLQRRV